MEQVSEPKPVAQSFCWVRILSVTQEATTPCEKHWVERQDRLGLDGGRPPSRLASASAARQVDGGPVGTWLADPDYFGRANAELVFDYGPVFDSREEAVCWIHRAEGQEWDREAVNRFLMGFEQCARVKPMDCHLQPEPEPEPEFARPKFPNSAWAPRFCTMDQPKPRKGLGTLLFEPEKVVCRDFPEWDISNDCDAVMAAKAQRAHLNADIRWQAQGFGQAIAPVLRVIGVDPDATLSADWKELIADLTEAVEPAIFQQKKRYSRPRPAQDCSGDLDPYFKQHHGGSARAHHLYPGHPSYPSGHATTAFVWAELIGAIRPLCKPLLLARAAEIAHNRVVAGLHFPTDTLGGHELALAIVREIFNEDNGYKRSFVARLTTLVSAAAPCPRRMARM